MLSTSVCSLPSFCFLFFFHPPRFVGAINHQLSHTREQRFCTTALCCSACERSTVYFVANKSSFAALITLFPLINLLMRNGVRATKAGVAAWRDEGNTPALPLTWILTSGRKLVALKRCSKTIKMDQTAEDRFMLLS